MEFLSVLATILALLVGFVHFTGWTGSEPRKPRNRPESPDGKVVDTVLIVSFLLLTIYQAWYPMLASKDFAFLLLTVSFVPPWIHHVYAYLALGIAAIVAFRCNPKVTIAQRFFLLINRHELLMERGLCFFLVVLFFFAFASFVLVDSERIAEKTVLPLPPEATGTSWEAPEDGVSKTWGISNNPWPRTRLLTATGEFWSRILFPVIGGILAAVALYFTYQRTTAIMDQTENGRRQIVAEQFKNAIDQLGDDKQAVTLGGVYMLCHLANSYPGEYAQTVFDILCGYIREETNLSAYKRLVSRIGDQDSLPELTKGDLKPVSLIVIQSIVNNLFYDRNGRAVFDDQQANLRGAFLDKIDFAETSLKQALLEGVRFRNADLSQADLAGARLNKSHCEKADCTSTDFDGANLTDARMVGVSLHQAVFSENTILKRTVLRGAQSSIDLKDRIKSALERNIPLETDLSGVLIFSGGRSLSMTPEEKREWFKTKGADVEALSPNQVQKLFQKRRPKSENES